MALNQRLPICTVCGRRYPGKHPDKCKNCFRCKDCGAKFGPMPNIQGGERYCGPCRRKRAKLLKG